MWYIHHVKLYYMKDLFYYPLRGNLGATGKVVVMWLTGSSPGNSLLCKNRVRLRTIHQMVGPLPVPFVCGSFSAPGCPFLSVLLSILLKTNLSRFLWLIFWVSDCWSYLFDCFGYHLCFSWWKKKSDSNWCILSCV